MLLVPPRNRVPRRSRTYRLPVPLLEALEAYAEETRRPVTTEIEIAIEEHLRQVGRWPAAKDQKPPKGKG